MVWTTFVCVPRSNPPPPFPSLTLGKAIESKMPSNDEKIGLLLDKVRAGRAFHCAMQRGGSMNRKLSLRSVLTLCFVL